MFRVRVGDFRIIYKIDWDKKNLIILFIDKRGKIYGYVKDEKIETLNLSI
ncbi:MAG TPA: hypothetical protein VJB35_06460 [Candidatus Nanoarchaeia archaeon]|nr:hypothetical protein [Candidatus Nanoarchaeia archaeon]